MDDEETDRQLHGAGTDGPADSLHALSPAEELMRREDGEAKDEGYGKIHEQIVEMMKAGNYAEGIAEIERLSMHKLLRFAFKHGCTPSNVFQQIVFLCKIVAPEILRSFGKELFAELGKCLNLTRAAMSANYKTRIVKMVEVSERRSGRATPTFKAPFQKSAAAAARMAAAQKGNTNRKKK